MGGWVKTTEVDKKNKKVESWKRLTVRRVLNNGRLDSIHKIWSKRGKNKKFYLVKLINFQHLSVEFHKKKQKKNLYFFLSLSIWYKLERFLESNAGCSASRHYRTKDHFSLYIRYECFNKIYIFCLSNNNAMIICKASRLIILKNIRKLKENRTLPDRDVIE